MPSALKHWQGFKGKYENYHLDLFDCPRPGFALLVLSRDGVSKKRAILEQWTLDPAVAHSFYVTVISDLTDQQSDRLVIGTSRAMLTLAKD